jgi:hypothetical protein
VNLVREGTPRYLGHFTAVSVFMFLLLISSVVSVDFAFAQSQTTEGQFPQSIIASSNTDSTPHLLKLKATQQGGTGGQEVSGFNLDVTNTVSAQLNSQLLVFVTDSSVRVIEAKVRTASDQVIDLIPSTSLQSTNAFALSNVPAGVYALDVITQKGNTRAAYEGMLVIGQQPTTIIEETTRRVTNEYRFFFPPLPKECPEGQVGIPPNCKPIPPLPPGCDVDNPPAVCPEPPICTEPECAPTECPDGQIVPPGNKCPDDPPEDPLKIHLKIHLEEMKMEEITTVTPLKETLSLIRI